MFPATYTFHSRNYIEKVYTGQKMCVMSSLTRTCRCNKLRKYLPSITLPSVHFRSFNNKNKKFGNVRITILACSPGLDLSPLQTTQMRSYLGQ